MKFLSLPILAILLLIVLPGCKFETCKIDFPKNKEVFLNAIKDIDALDLVMTSNQTYYRPIETITLKDGILKNDVFAEIEFVECHEDGTIIFQAPNCIKGSAIRDVVYFLSYSPKGIEHVKGKRNLGRWEKVYDSWFLCEHINSVAN